MAGLAILRNQSHFRLFAFSRMLLIRFCHDVFVKQMTAARKDKPFWLLFFLASLLALGSLGGACYIPAPSPTSTLISGERGWLTGCTAHRVRLANSPST